MRVPVQRPWQVVPAPERRVFREPLDFSAIYGAGQKGGSNRRIGAAAMAPGRILPYT